MNHATIMHAMRHLSKSPPPSKRAGSRDADHVPSSLGERLLTTEEVAQLLCVSRSTVYYLMRCGELPSYLVGRVWRLCRRDVLAYMERRGRQTHRKWASCKGGRPAGRQREHQRARG